MIDPFNTAPPEPLKTQILKALLREYTVWCDDDHLKVRLRGMLYGDPTPISWAEARGMTGLIGKPIRSECNDYTRQESKTGTLD